MKTGKCKVELSITINTGNFSSVKSTVGFEEDYFADTNLDNPELENEVREARFQELLGVCNDKLDEAVLTAVKKIKEVQSNK